MLCYMFYVHNRTRISEKILSLLNCMFNLVFNVCYIACSINHDSEFWLRYAINAKEVWSIRFRLYFLCGRSMQYYCTYWYYYSTLRYIKAIQRELGEGGVCWVAVANETANKTTTIPVETVRSSKEQMDDKTWSDGRRSCVVLRYATLRYVAFIQVVKNENIMWSTKAMIGRSSSRGKQRNS